MESNVQQEPAEIKEESSSNACDSSTASSEGNSIESSSPAVPPPSPAEDGKPYFPLFLGHSVTPLGALQSAYARQILQSVPVVPLGPIFQQNPLAEKLYLEALRAKLPNF